MNIKVKQYAHGEGAFWQIMGPCFASSDIRRELGIPMSSDEAYTWFLAMDGETLAGFAAVKTHDKTCEFKHGYVFPDYREKGLHEKLLHERLKFARQTGCGLCRAVVAPAVKKQYAAAGFKQQRTQGKYSVMEIGLEAK